jgi:hypothetical protein
MLSVVFSPIGELISTGLLSEAVAIHDSEVKQLMPGLRSRSLYVFVNSRSHGLRLKTKAPRFLSISVGPEPIIILKNFWEIDRVWFSLLNCFCVLLFFEIKIRTCFYQPEDTKCSLKFIRHNVKVLFGECLFRFRSPLCCPINYVPFYF